MGNQASILVIHKDNNARREIHNIISRFDFNITYADDGLQGLHTARQINPDLIICQIDIKIINGLNLAEMLKKEDELKHIPLILLHDMLDLATINKAKQIKAKAFLIKPYIDNSLIYAIKRALKEEQLEVNLTKAPVSYDACKSPVLTGYKYHYA